MHDSRGKFRHLVFYDDQDLEHFKFAITELHDEGFNPNYKTKVIEVPIP